MFFMSNTPARRKASKKYLLEKVDEIKIRIPKGEKERIKAHAEQFDGGSVNAFIWRAMLAQMKRDTAGEE